MIYLKYHPEKMLHEGSRSWVNSLHERVIETAENGSPAKLQKTPEGNRKKQSIPSSVTDKPKMDHAGKVVQDVPLSRKMKVGYRVINVDSTDRNFGKMGTVLDLRADDSCDWNLLGVRYAPVIVTIKLDTGETVSADEHYWLPVDR